MELACPECGRIRRYRPATIARLKSHTCWDCRSAKKKAAWVTLKCPHCGSERSMKPSEAAKRAGQSCRKCPVYVPREMPGTFDAGYVVGAVLGDGSIIRDTKRDGTCGYYVVLAVRDVAFAERFRRHASACMGRKPWIKSYVVRRKGNPDIGMPPTIATEWHVKVGSREWYDLLSPYKHGREFGDLPARSEEFRKGFLQGIFDSEGYIGPTGYRDIAGKDMDLLRVVKSVLESLGEKAAIYGPYPYSRGVAHLRTTTKLQKTTVRAE